MEYEYKNDMHAAKRKLNEVMNKDKKLYLRVKSSMFDSTLVSVPKRSAIEYLIEVDHSHKEYEGYSFIAEVNTVYKIKDTEYSVFLTANTETTSATKTKGDEEE